MQKSSAIQKISGVSLSEVKNYVLGNYIGILWFHRFFSPQKLQRILKINLFSLSCISLNSCKNYVTIGKT